MNFLNSLLLVKETTGTGVGSRVGVGAGLEVEAGEKALEVRARESLLLVEAFGRVPASLLSTELIGGGFRQELRQK